MRILQCHFMDFARFFVEIREDIVTDRESENFLVLATAMLKLMQIESQLMLGVIPIQHRQKIFEIISRESFDLLFTDGDVSHAQIHIFPIHII